MVNGKLVGATAIDVITCSIKFKKIYIFRNLIYFQKLGNNQQDRDTGAY